MSSHAEAAWQREDRRLTSQPGTFRLPWLLGGAVQSSAATGSQLTTVVDRE